MHPNKFLMFTDLNLEKDKPLTININKINLESITGDFA